MGIVVGIEYIRHAIVVIIGAIRFFERARQSKRFRIIGRSLARIASRNDPAYGIGKLIGIRRKRLVRCDLPRGCVRRYGPEINGFYFRNYRAAFSINCSKTSRTMYFFSSLFTKNLPISPAAFSQSTASIRFFSISLNLAPSSSIICRVD